VRIEKYIIFLFIGTKGDFLNLDLIFSTVRRSLLPSSKTQGRERPSALPKEENETLGF
jgi:hypothetical protein